MSNAFTTPLQNKPEPNAMSIVEWKSWAVRVVYTDCGFKTAKLKKRISLTNSAFFH